ncbi:hypothetical protein BA894_01335 [Vibrio natriegens]|uniref:hypothetical protein n=1 Tax=Vibrio natriegens TaxID=691 RepID=UPI000803EC5A|nr:hypothetical protein [Vibrio natriegens]ANQ25173.1 hypothetical protein BA894_01335 [Vibrio natriegens]
MVILQGYVFGAMLVALYFLLLMVRKLDSYDWKYDKADISFQFALLVALWPLLILGWIKQRRLNGIELLRSSSSSSKSACQREMGKDYLEIKPCGAYVRFTPTEVGICEESHSEFVFPSKDIEQLLLKILDENPQLKHSEEGALLVWVQGRNNYIQEPVDVPGVWPRFVFLVDDLIKQNTGTVQCKICQKHLDLEQLQEKMTTGYSFTMRGYVCPQGHTIVSNEGVRLYRG